MTTCKYMECLRLDQRRFFTFYAHLSAPAALLLAPVLDPDPIKRPALPDVQDGLNTIVSFTMTKGEIATHGYPTKWAGRPAPQVNE